MGDPSKALSPKGRFLATGFIFQNELTLNEKCGAEGEQSEGFKPEVPIPTVQPNAQAP